MATEDETTAIRRGQEGNASAFEAVILRYYAPMVRLAYLLTGDHALAEDLAQEGFLQAYRHLHQFHLGQPFQPWIARIIINLARQQQRRHARHPEISLHHPLAEHLTSAAPDPVEQAQRTEERATIVAALALLTPHQREAVVLRYYGNLSDHEMAAALNCRADTARQRIRSGLRALEMVIRAHYPWLITDSNVSAILPRPKEIAPHDPATI